VALIITVADPNAADVRALLDGHLAFARQVTPPGHVHALDTGAWSDPDLTLFGARRDGSLVGVGALRRLDAAHAEVKSMHTRAEARGQGVARAMLDHLLGVAEASGYRRVSLETGTADAFAAARSLYLGAGFRPCAPFGQYTVNPHSVCLTLTLTGPRRPGLACVASA
jgi:putative acetyltransferase